MKVRFLVGPTASGKTAVAELLAERFGVPVLSADAMLVYRSMNIGTDKPVIAERKGIQYGGLDFVDPDQDYNVWQWLCAAREQLKEWHGAGLVPIVAGGTGLYINALLNGLSRSAEPDSQRRKYLENLLREQGVGALQQVLEKVYPGGMEKISDPANPRRVIRAIEKAEAGTALENDIPPPEGPAVPCLEWPVELLRKRIELRVRRMYAGGLVDEAHHLRNTYASLSRTALQAIGYREAFAFIDGEMNLEEAIMKTVYRTCRLAKRQRTWFRHQCRCDWINAQVECDTASLADDVARSWENNGLCRISLA